MVKNRRVLYLEKLKINPQKYKVNTNPETKRIKMALEKLFSGKVDFKISKIVKAFTNWYWEYIFLKTAKSNINVKQF